LALAQAKLDKTQITAPFDGVIGLRGVSVGEFVSPGQTFEGEAYAISPLVDAGGRSVLVSAEVDNAQRTLYPGMFVRVQLIVSESPALVIPEAALAPSG